MPEAARTLVKSSPELWAEVSDPTALARHLGAFGDIRITRLEPEATVAWEGDRASGTVDLQPTGWGTKVTVTADEIAPPEPGSEPVAAGPEPVAPQDPPRRGLLARLLRRRRPEPEPPATAVRPESAPARTEPTRTEPARTEAALDSAAVLDEMLQTLGAAHRRPLSR